MNKILYVFVIIVSLMACNSGNDYVPKPHAYPKMEFPVKKYLLFDSAHCPYTFEMPVYANMTRDTHDMAVVKPTWYNLNFQGLNATLHLTYYRFNNWAFFDSLTYDSRRLVNKHLQRADDILEQTVSGGQPNVTGVIFSIEGNTATNYNFYVTDSIQHFLRGALYFNSHTEPDSIAPAFEFVKQDIDHLIKTLHWK